MCIFRVHMYVHMYTCTSVLMYIDTGEKLRDLGDHIQLRRQVVFLCLHGIHVYRVRSTRRIRCHFVLCVCVSSAYVSICQHTSAYVSMRQHIGIGGRQPSRGLVSEAEA